MTYVPRRLIEWRVGHNFTVGAADHEIEAFIRDWAKTAGYGEPVATAWVRHAIECHRRNQAAADYASGRIK